LSTIHELIPINLVALHHFFALRVVSRQSVDLHLHMSIEGRDGVIAVVILPLQGTVTRPWAADWLVLISLIACSSVSGLYANFRDD
jgi:hypothetical protein